MEKTFATDDHKELLEAAGGRVFTYFERSDKMTKSASEVITRAMLQEHMPPSTHFGVHLISMGAEEDYGPNRNGDSASRKSLQSHHPTFEKYGCVYREHANRDPVTQGVGDVRLAAYNPKMNRGELIVWVDKDKAPDMYKEAKAGNELSWSMSMRLPHDECSCCRHKAKRVSDYCGHLRNHMLQWVDGHEKFAYARNEDDVKFFDISEVKRRADRIATYLSYTFPEGEMAKAASAGDIVITGAQWADHLRGDIEIAMFDPWEEITLEKLAEAVEFVKHADQDTVDTLAKMAPQDLTEDQIEVLAQPDFRSAGGELAKRAMFINFPTFASMVTGKPIAELRKEASFCDVEGIKLPNLLSDLFRDGGSRCGEKVAETVEPDECGCSFSSEKDNIDRLMSEVGGELGMDQGSTSGRALKVTIVKSAKVAKPRESKPLDAFYSGMADAYGYYLVKAAHQAKDYRGVNPSSLFRALAASLVIQRS